MDPVQCPAYLFRVSHGFQSTLQSQVMVKPDPLQVLHMVFVVGSEFCGDVAPVPEKAHLPGGGIAPFEKLRKDAKLLAGYIGDL